MDQETNDNLSWRSLSTAISKDETPEETLSKSNADYEVFLTPVLVWDHVQDDIVPVKNRFVTGRDNPNGNQTDNWEVVKERYEVVQNKDVLKRAATIVERSSGKAKLHSCGVLDEGRKFFVAISFGAMEMQLPNDSVEHIDHYLIVISSHDATMPICYYNLDVRRRNNAVYRISSDVQEFDLRKRHTTNLKDSGVEASEALQLRAGWTEAIQDAIRSLQLPVSTSLKEKVLNIVVSKDKANTKKKRDYANSVHDEIDELFLKPHNSGLFGKSRWALYNAIVEYIDFHRNIPPEEAAQHALEIDNYSHRLKLQVFNALIP